MFTKNLWFVCSKKTKNISHCGAYTHAFVQWKYACTEVQSAECCAGQQEGLNVSKMGMKCDNGELILCCLSVSQHLHSMAPVLSPCSGLLQMLQLPAGLPPCLCHQTGFLGLATAWLPPLATNYYSHGIQDGGAKLSGIQGHGSFQPSIHHLIPHCCVRYSPLSQQPLLIYQLLRFVAKHSQLAFIFPGSIRSDRKSHLRKSKNENHSPSASIDSEPTCFFKKKIDFTLDFF